MIAAVIVTLLIYRGAQQNTGTFPYPHGWAFASSIAAQIMHPLGYGVNSVLEATFILLQLAVVLTFLVIVTYSKHLHIGLAPLNIMFSRRQRAGAAGADALRRQGARLEYAYYRESIDELNRTRGGRGEDPFALTDTGKSHLETGFTMQIQVDRNSTITSVKLAAFHTTPNGRLLLDAQLFAPPSPNPYIMEPDETERRRRTTSRQATARGGGWKFRDRDPERVRQEYPDRRQARSMADQMRRKRQATPSADEPDSKKPKT